MPENSITKWHSLSNASASRILQTNLEKGLTEEEAKKRQAFFGFNKLPEEKPASTLVLFFSQFKSPLIYILVFAGIITVLLKDRIDALIIFSAVFLNAFIGYFQEEKTSKTLSALKKIIHQEAVVIRDGQQKIIDTRELAPGDLIVLNAGDKIPADAKIIASHDFKVNQMTLTGEWLADEKTAGILALETPLADRGNMLYLGTTVETGRAKAVVTAIGLDTELGGISRMLKEAKGEATPYQKQLVNLSRFIGLAMALIAGLIFINGLAIGFDLQEIFTTAVAVAVAAVPEGLPAATTVILAMGMERILKKKGLVRQLISAETLGVTSVICTDKTGTLTEGRMKVKKVILPGQVLRREQPNKEAAFFALKIAALTSEAFIENPTGPREKWIFRGAPTEKALLEALYTEEFDGYHQPNKCPELAFKKTKVDELLFNPVNKFSAVLYQPDKKNYFLSLFGSPEKVLEFANFYRLKEKERPLLEAEKAELNLELEKIAGKGLRIVATAYKKINLKKRLSAGSEIEKELSNLVLAGFITLDDPLREEVKAVIGQCRQMGIRPIIVTGDHKLTAKAIAESLGFGKISESNILEGSALDKMSDCQLKAILENIQIYSRVEPKHKMRIIRAWQEKGEVVAMTGDGINDAPALRQAEIGVALGSATEVAKEAADLVLLTDSFSVIVAAIEEGRAILDNIRKVITYLLSDSFTEVILVGASLLFRWPLPVTAGQILWVNLIEDTLPSFALAFEPKEKDLLSRPPQRKNTPLINREMKVLIFIIGIVTDFLLLGLFCFLIRYTGYEIRHIRTIIFVGLAIDSLFYVFSCRSLRKNIWQINPFSNMILIFAWFLCFLLLVAAVYLPALQTLLKTAPLNFFDWQLVLLLGFLNVCLIEITKRYFIQKEKNELVFYDGKN